MRLYCGQYNAERTYLSRSLSIVSHAADMKFRPCIDIHDGVVKQIVGGTLKDAPVGSTEAPKTNFVAEQPSDYFARFVRRTTSFYHRMFLTKILAACTLPII